MLPHRRWRPTSSPLLAIAWRGSARRFSGRPMRYHQSHSDPPRGYIPFRGVAPPKAERATGHELAGKCGPCQIQQTGWVIQVLRAPQIVRRHRDNGGAPQPPSGWIASPGHHELLATAELDLVVRGLARTVGAQAGVLAVSDRTGQVVEVLGTWGDVMGLEGLPASLTDRFLGRAFASERAVLEPLAANGDAAADRLGSGDHPRSHRGSSRGDGRTGRSRLRALRRCSGWRGRRDIADRRKLRAPGLPLPHRAAAARRRPRHRQARRADRMSELRRDSA